MQYLHCLHHAGPLCGCCEDLNLCIYACMCPCVLYGRMAQVLYPNLSNAASSNPGWWSTMYIIRKCFGSTASLTAALRDQIQELQGSAQHKRCCSNFCLHVWCQTCAVIQVIQCNSMTLLCRLLPHSNMMLQHLPCFHVQRLTHDSTHLVLR
jgi:Cys-rich protein (TIGR01571 family)